MRLLVTRPEPDGERTAAALRALGHDVMLAPLLFIEALAGAGIGPGPWAAILLTSANGARAIAQHARCSEFQRLPVLAVGRGSADAARACGFADVNSADGDAGDLAGLAAERFAGSGTSLLYLAGEDRARDLAGALAARGVPVETVVVYRAGAAASLPAAAETALRAGTIDGVLHFSRRSVDTYMRCSAAMLFQALRPIHYCLSARAAEPLKAAGAADVRVAAQPDEAALLELVTSRP